MKRPGRVTAICIGLLVFFLGSSLGAQAATPSTEERLKTAEGVVSQLYALVTFEPGSTPDWDQVRSLFIDEAVIVLRTSREATAVFSVEGFVDDFVGFIQRANAEATGFKEEIVRTKSMVFGDIAHILVLYEASIPGSDKPPLQGVDSFELIRKSGRWWIVAVTNELPTPDHPVPPEIQDP